METDKKKTRGAYYTFWRIMRRYFSDYGGWTSLIKSPFLHIGLVISAISYSVWISSVWIDNVYAVIPGLLGFSLGTYALLFSLMSGRIKLALKAIKNSRECSYLDEINATFLHFILVQTVCLLWAATMRSHILFDVLMFLKFSKKFFVLLDIGRVISGFVGYSLMCYSLTLVIASSLVVYRLARIVSPSPE
jgi:hypothetical protein